MKSDNLRSPNPRIAHAIVPRARGATEPFPFHNHFSMSEVSVIEKDRGYLSDATIISFATDYQRARLASYMRRNPRNPQDAA